MREEPWVRTPPLSLSVKAGFRVKRSGGGHLPVGCGEQKQKRGFCGSVINRSDDAESFVLFLIIACASCPHFRSSKVIPESPFSSIIKKIDISYHTPDSSWCGGYLQVTPVV